LGFVRSVAESAAGGPVELAACERVRLVRPIAPDETVACEVTLEPGEPLRARAQLSVGAANVGTLVVTLAPAKR
jgi:hypothetical protein